MESYKKQASTKKISLFYLYYFGLAIKNKPIFYDVATWFY